MVLLNAPASTVRVTLNDLSRLPVERLARLLLERAAEDPMLLTRLHATIEESTLAVAETAIASSRPSLPDVVFGESPAIHAGSRRREGPFVAVNCAAIPSNLVASELFGYEKGAFTGANARTKGQIEHAHGGTLFLDKIGDMPVDLQGHLLRFLQEGQIVRVGGRESIKVDVRIVSATNVRLREAIAEGRFPEDLYYRLNVLTLPLPALRERLDDIEPLARHFLKIAARDFGRSATDFDADALLALRRHSWPGNVRELMSAIRRAVVIGDGDTVKLCDLMGIEDVPRPVPVLGAKPLPRAGSAEERDALLAALARHGENVTMTAQDLGVSRVTLYRMLRRHAVSLDRGLKEPPIARGGSNAQAAVRIGAVVE